MMNHDNNVFDLKSICIEYCLNDVILTQKILFNLFKIIDDESKSIRIKSLSAPAISHKLFYSKYNNFNIKEKINIEEDIYIRKSYFGGRCEVFGNSNINEHIKYYDFSGMYGQCMLENFHTGESFFNIPNNLDAPGFYNIDYKSNFSNFPVLPNHKNNKLMFSNGIKNGTF
jgi:hypothetical protein